MRPALLIAAASVAALSSFGFTTEAEAKQCVWNKGGFVLRVDWFAPDVIETAAGTGGLYFNDQPAQTDVIWAGSGRCIDRGPINYQAVLSVCGRKSDIQVESYPATWPVDSRIDCGIWTLTVPSTSRYLDVWGPVWAPESGNGGPI